MFDVVRKSLVVAMSLLTALACTASGQSNFAASAPPLTFSNNFFVTGDYVVAGAYGMNTKTTNMNGITYAVGTINVPDKRPGTIIVNPGITGATSVPAGAQIVAALLYWQTVEKVGVMPGQTGSGQNGFFRSTLYGKIGPQAPGYSLAGVDVTGHTTVSFSSGGCSGGSTGKIVRTYRADVRAYLPQDSSGNVLANSTYEVLLPNTGSTTPITLGATLVIIYRVLSPDVPLNSVVIYEGGFAPSSASQVMSQTVQGFYQAGNSPLSTNMNSPVSRLTHIAGSGQSNKFENVYLNDLVHPLPNHYANGLPPFPGWYGSWDNPTWTFGDPNFREIANPIQEGATSPTSSATTMIKASSSQPAGCVSSAAVILSTTVKNTDKDGILDIWKVPAAPYASTPGYCDASVNGGQCKPGDPAWVDLPGAVLGGVHSPHKDVFIQLDYMCSRVTGDDSCDIPSPVNPLSTNYSFDPGLTGAVDMMTSAFLGDGVTRPPVHVHVNPVNPMGTTQPVHAIQEQMCVDNNPSNSPLCAPALQPFPNQPGVVGWKGGFEFLKSQPVNYQDESFCEQALNGPCIRRFQYARKDSYHYAVFAHAIGRANWGLQGGSLANVTASNNMVTFTTSAPHGLVVDSQRGNGRVTIADAITNPNLNGTYKVTSVSPQASILNITATSMSALGIATYTFTKVSGSTPAKDDLVTVQNTTNGSGVFNIENAKIASPPTNSTFTVDFNVKGFTPSTITMQSEPGGCAPPSSGGTCAQTNRPPFSFTINIPNLGSPQGPYTAFTDPNLTVTSGQASTGSGFSDIGGGDTLVALGLWGDPSKPATNPPGLTKTVQAGTFMHELGHTLGLTHGGLFYDKLAQNPQDYTPTLEANCKSNYQSVMNYMFQADLLGPSGVLDFSSQPLSALHENSVSILSSSGIAFPTTTWYDLAPNLVGSKARHHCDGSTAFFNANVPPFSADVTPIMYPHLNQPIPASWPAPLDINFDGTIDGSAFGFRGYDDWANIDLRQIGATGSDVTGPGKLGGGPGKLGGGPGRLGGGPGRLGGGPGASLEIDFETANAATRPPRNLTAMEDPSPRYIHLFWFPPTFGQIGSYNVYQQPPWTPGTAPTFSVAVGGPSLVFHNTLGDPHFGEYEFVDKTATCNPTGYQYFVSAVLVNTTQESGPSNSVSKGQNNESLTGCYLPPVFLLPAAKSSPLIGSPVPVTWTVQDASNQNGVTFANNPGSNTLIAVGPISDDVACDTSATGPRSILPSAGNPIAFNSNTNQFSFSWNTSQGFNGTTAAFPQGCYLLEVDLDSGQPFVGQASAFQVQIYLSDANESVLITTTSPLPDAIAGIPYSQTLTLQTPSGVAPVAWTIVPNSVMPGNGSTLPGISFDPNNPGRLFGTPTAVGTYTFTVQAKDSIGDFGTQVFTLKVVAPVAQLNQPMTPESAVPGAAGFLLTVNGTGFYAGSAVLWNGNSQPTNFISTNKLTAMIPSGNVAAIGTASIKVANAGSPNSNIDFFQITNPTNTTSLSRTDTATGNGPRGLIAADFDGDGKVDVAIANNSANTVSILLGNGDGSFTAKPNLITGNAAGTGPNSLVVGDFNNDGKLDLAFTNFGDNNVSVFLGNGDGTFQPGVTYASGNAPFSLVTGDFNRDGKLDLAVANQNDHTISVLLGKGDGTFQAHVDYAAGGSGILDAADVALGDFNGDGKLDLAVTNPSADKVSVLLGNGDGTFQAPAGYSTGVAGSHPIAVSAADFNGDGKLDLAITNLNTGTVAVLIGKGDGTFQNQQSYATTAGATNGPTAITTGDFNGDGVLDITVTDQDDNSVSVLLGDGGGTFQSALTFTTGATAAGVVAGDFNGDGRLDVAVTNFGTNTLSILLQRPEPATNLAVSGATASQVSLTWTASASTTVVGYNVYRGTTSGGPYTKLNSGIVTAPAFTDISVDPGTTYYYVVSAVDPGNLESVFSNEASATTPAGP